MEPGRVQAGPPPTSELSPWLATLPPPSPLATQLLDGVMAAGPESSRVLGLLAYCFKDLDRCGTRGRVGLRVGGGSSREAGWVGR